jgi:hypothetical protein
MKTPSVQPSTVALAKNAAIAGAAGTVGALAVTYLASLAARGITDAAVNTLTFAKSKKKTKTTVADD